jgi:hypothetical protein
MFRNLTKGLKAPSEPITRSIGHRLAAVAVRPPAAYLRSREHFSADHPFRSARVPLYDQRLLSWAFVHGLRPRSFGPHLGVRPSRAMLPDVDFAGAMAEPGRRPLFAVLAEVLRRRRGTARASAPADMLLSGAIAAAGPQALPASYSAEPLGDGAVPGGSGDTAAQLERPRAA